MITLFSNNYLSSLPIERAMRRFSKNFQPHQRVLDLGCGRKPYASFFNCKYIGVDPLPQVNPDFVCDAWNTPFPDHMFDGLILNQSLEHIADTQATITEIFRLLKPGGIAIITVPQTMKNHSHALPAIDAPVQNFDRTDHPYWHVDYYRFTKYGLMHLFRNFKIVYLKETNGYGSTILQLINYFFSSLNKGAIFSPIFFFNNMLGVLLDTIFDLLAKIPLPFFHKLHHYVYSTLTINYILIVKKHD